MFFIGDPFRRNIQEYSLVGSTEVWLGSLAHASDTKAQLLHLINYNGAMVCYSQHKY